jgi:hypothetical protein
MDKVNNLVFFWYRGTGSVFYPGVLIRGDRSLVFWGVWYKGTGTSKGGTRGRVPRRVVQGDGFHSHQVKHFK